VRSLTIAVLVLAFGSSGCSQSSPGTVAARPQQIQGQAPAPGRCHLRQTAFGQPLPDPLCTPGAVDLVVRASSLANTVCRRGGYTASVRPSRTASAAAKRQIMAAYGLAWADAGRYELDHLIPLNAGGSSNVANLWPEPNVFRTGLARPSAYLHNDKDQAEVYTFHALCSGQTDLARLQQAMSTDWTTAVERLGLAPIPAGYTG
jgi:hypothetical protein